MNFVKDLLDSYENLSCSMSLKIQFLHSHLEYFLENLGFASDEQSEVSTRKQPPWNSAPEQEVTKQLWGGGDYCWFLYRETS
jgi:hypothetical protein